MSHNHKHKKRRRPRIQRRTAPGASPGTVTVDPSSPRPRIHVLAYGPDHFVEREIKSLDDIRQFVGKYPVTWVNVDGLGDVDTIRKLGEIFGLHRLVMEDMVNVHQRPKVDPYEQQLYIVARMVTPVELLGKEHLGTEQLSLYLGANFVLTVQEEPGDCWDPVRERIRRRVGRIRTAGPDYLTYALLDAAIDAYFPVLEYYGDRLDELEEAVLHHGADRVIDRMHEVKGDLLLLRRTIWPHREALAELARESTPAVTEPTRVYLRDCYDHVIQLLDLVEIYREVATDLRDVYMSAVSNRINETMRVLTMIATVFLPLSFIAGVYGMNFRTDASPWNMPELLWPWGYAFALALMAATTLGMLTFFRRQGWVGRRKAKP
jgi:magnesium transporter